MDARLTVRIHRLEEAKVFQKVQYVPNPGVFLTGSGVTNQDVEDIQRQNSAEARWVDCAQASSGVAYETRSLGQVGYQNKIDSYGGESRL